MYHILGFEHILAHRLVHSPHNLAHVKVAIQLGTGIEVLHLIVAEQIEGKTIRHDILALHGATLLRRIEFLVERIVRTHILIKRNAYGMLTHHDTLVERSNLGIEIRLRKFWNPIVQTAERLLELGIDVIHIGIFSLSIGNQSL